MRDGGPNTRRERPLAIVVGGRFDGARREAARSGDQPRVDVIEMERTYPADLYDYTWLEACAEREWVTRALVYLVGGQLGRMSEALVIRLALDADKYDAIFATGEDVGLPLALLLRLAKKRRSRLVMRFESLHYGGSELKRRVYRLYTRLASPRVSVFVSRTHVYEDYLRDELLVPPASIAFAPEPIDGEFFDVARTQPSPPDYVPQQPYLLSAGLELRDYDTLVEAVRDLPVKVLIAAGSPWSKRRYTLGEGEATNVTLKRFTQRELRELYAHASAVVVPVHSSLRSCGISVVNEATQMGCPVIASGTAGLKSYIEDGVNGIFFQPGDAAGLRQSILQVLQPRGDLKQMAARAQARTRADASLEGYVERIRALLLNLPTRPLPDSAEPPRPSHSPDQPGSAGGLE